MVVFHRFSPRTNGGVKRDPPRKHKIKQTSKAKRANLMEELMELGYSYEVANGCIPYLESYEINAALTVIYELLER
jgi:hypothetical protein